MQEPLPEDARAEVMRRLDAIRVAHDARILLAVESGSRAWGFHSPDSDFDARFLFVRREEKYLSLTEPRDVIETPIEGLFDVNGWDLGKALKLMIRGNSVIQEWLASPHVYIENQRFTAALRPIAAAWRSSYADAFHYCGLLGSQYGRYLKDRASVKLKRYFYVVRPALALQWLRDRPGEAPPMDLPGLLAGLTLPPAVAEALAALRQAKAATSELGEGPRIAALDAYVKEMQDWGMEARGPAPRPEPSLLASTDMLYRAAIKGAFE